MEDKNNYTIKIECDNCKHAWDETVLKGHKVINISCLGAKVVEDNDTKETQNYIKEIGCPNCGCKTETKRSNK